MLSRSLLSVLFLLGTLLLSLSSAYVPQHHQPRRPALFSLEKASASSSSISSNNNLPAQIAAASAFVMVNAAPLVAMAVEEENYEYGAVDAPIGLAVGGGILAILTALLPILLRGGEEAFEEMKDRDSDTFGKSDNKDVLKGRKK